MQVDIAFLFNTVLSVLALAGYASQWAKGIKEKGVMENTITNLKKDLEEEKGKILTIQFELSQTCGDMKAVNTDIKHIMESLVRIERKLDNGANE